jgi:hypothetical protein
VPNCELQVNLGAFGLENIRDYNDMEIVQTDLLMCYGMVKQYKRINNVDLLARQFEDWVPLYETNLVG